MKLFSINQAFDHVVKLKTSDPHHRLRLVTPKESIMVLIDEPFNKDEIIVPFDFNFRVTEFLDLIYSKIYKSVNPYTFAEDWTLINEGTGNRLKSLELLYRNREETNFDNLIFEEAGLVPGMILRTIMLKKQRI